MISARKKKHPEKNINENLDELATLGHESRMNTPSTLGGNWCWRAEPGAFNTRLAKKLHSEMELYGRLPE